ncbi:hypothetical protein NL676_007616 [Syzygium grande]|nr:hypothetical protein NL676_007616 [Syzygium grande]
MTGIIHIVRCIRWFLNKSLSLVHRREIDRNPSDRLLDCGRIRPLRFPIPAPSISGKNSISAADLMKCSEDRNVGRRKLKPYLVRFATLKVYTPSIWHSRT